MNYCIYEAEQGIKTAKRRGTEHPYDTQRMIACWQGEPFVFYYFPLLSQTLPSTLKFIEFIGDSETRIAFGYVERKAETEPAFKNTKKKKCSDTHNAFLLREMEFRFIGL